MKTFKEYIREHEDAWEKDSAGNAVGWKAKEYQRKNENMETRKPMLINLSNQMLLLGVCRSCLNNT